MTRNSLYGGADVKNCIPCEIIEATERGTYRARVDGGIIEAVTTLFSDLYEVMENLSGEIVEIFENPDGSATAILDGEAVKKWKDAETATSALYRAGFRF